MLIAVLIAVTPAPTVVPPAEAAPLEQHHPVTYNMRGGSTSTDRKWTTDILDRIRDHDVVAVREAGPIPFPGRAPVPGQAAERLLVRPLPRRLQPSPAAGRPRTGLDRQLQQSRFRRKYLHRTGKH